MVKILTIGSSVRDVFIVSDDFEIIRSPKFEGGRGECVSLGAKIEISELHKSYGGGANNSAKLFSGLKIQTSILTKIGDDEEGDQIMSNLKKSKIDCDHVIKVKNGETGYSTLLTTESGERSVLVYRGVSSNFDKKDLVSTKVDADHIYLTSIGGNLEMLQKIERLVNNKSIKLTWNPGKTEIKQGISKLRGLIKASYIFNLNKEEAEMLLGTQKATMNALLHGIRQRADQIILITDGPNGTYALCPEGVFHSGTRDVKAISRTGAGDAFGSGFTAGLIKGLNISEALQFATLNAESVIQSFGAQNGLLTKIPDKKTLNKISIKKL